MRLHTLLFVSVAPVIIGLAACGDDETTTTTTTASSSTADAASSTTGGTGGGGPGGTGGAGGGATSGGGMGGMGGAGGGEGGAGGAGGGSNLINGCDPAMATDQTGDPTATIMTMGLAYSPKCVRISTGTEVTFNSDFTLHPLRGGTVEGVTPTEDPNSPIKATNTGMMAKFTFPAKGTYGFYCNNHAAAGMAGAIFVE